jgi:Uma2 family endonuclease
MQAPAPLRFTREMYHRMAGEGLFDGLKVELLDGEIVRMSPQDSRHARAVYRAHAVLSELLSGRFLVRSQLPIVLDDHSEPEPDVAVCLLEPAEYDAAHPKATQVVLILEVAGSSLGYDRGSKAAAYARSGIAAYVVLSLIERTLEVMTEPDRAAGRYRTKTILGQDDSLDLPGGAKVASARLLPPVTA